MSQKTTCLKRAVALPPLPEQQQLEFCERVDLKLAALSAVPLHEQPASFGLSQKRRETLEMDRKLLESVVRIDEPVFDLQSVLDHYNLLWRKPA